MALNRVTLIGHAGKDPEIKHLESGVTVATLSLATTESFKDRNGQYQEQTEWHNIVFWRHLAERAEQQIRKGSLVYVEGRLRTRSWEDQNGQKHYLTEVIANDMELCMKSSDDNASAKM